MKTKLLGITILCTLLLNLQTMWAADAVATAKIEAFNSVGTKTYSAEPGDLSTAIDQAGANGTVTIGEGVAVVSSLKDINKSLTIKGAGAGLTTITGKASSYNDPSTGCGMTTAGPSNNSLKALIRIGGSNSDVVVNIRDLTLDGGDCGGTYNEMFMGFIPVPTAHDFDVLRVNGGASAYSVNIYNCVLKGAKAKTIMQVGTGSNKGYVSMYNCKVSKSGSQFYADVDVVNNGSWTKAYSSYFEGFTQGAITTDDNCNYSYQMDYRYGTNGSSTSARKETYHASIENLMDWYETNHSFAAFMPALKAEDLNSGKNVLESMVYDLADCSIDMCSYTKEDKWDVLNRFTTDLESGKTALIAGGFAEVDVNTYIQVLHSVVAAGKPAYIACGADPEPEDKIIPNGEEYNVTTDETIGDLTIMQGGVVNIKNGATLTVNNFTLKATQGASGQLKPAAGLVWKGKVCMDMSFTNASHTMDGTRYYSFSVPFPVEMNGGIFRLGLADDSVTVTGEVPAPQNEILRIRQYNGARRAATTDASVMNGWDLLAADAVLMPGVFYMVDFVDNAYYTYRFYLKEGESIYCQVMPDLNVYPSANPQMAGWNGVGNYALEYSTAELHNTVTDKIQIFRWNTGAFATVDASAVSLVVGAPFFVQTATEGYVEMVAPTGTEDFAPQRQVRAADARMQYALSIRGEEETFDDQLFVTVSEDAEAEYTIGRDLAKMSYGKADIAQVWVRAYNAALSVYDAAASEEPIEVAISLCAPKAGNYTLSLKEQGEGVMYLVKDGVRVANLSMQDFELSLPAGTNREYGLLIEPNKVVTGVGAQTVATETGKVLRGGKLYIVRGEQVFTAEGQRVK